jgi:mRNA interferase MazF
VTTRSTVSPHRGDVWLLRFDPVRGAEIGKQRPAAVVSLPSVGKLPLRIVVPITEWKSKYSTAPWLVYLNPSKRNGLTKLSAADCFQVKSVSVERFAKKLGELRADEVEEISAAIALCVGA